MTAKQLAANYSSAVSPYWVADSLEVLRSQGLVENIGHWALPRSYRLTADGLTFIEENPDISLARDDVVFEHGFDHLGRGVSPGQAIELGPVAGESRAVDWTKWGAIIGAIGLGVTILVAVL